MPESADLLREARQALRAAEALVANGFFGDAVTRAYYAMFYAARALLATKQVYPKTHGGVLRALGLHFVTQGLLSKDLAAAFGVALEARQRADYGSLTAFTRDQTSEIVDSARRFVDRADSLLSSRDH